MTILMKLNEIKSILLIDINNIFLEEKIIKLLDDPTILLLIVLM